MDILKIFVVAIISAILSVLVKQHKPEYAILIQICSGVLIFALVLSSVKDLISALEDLTQASGIEKGYLSLMLKALGISIVTQIASDTCKDSGNTSLASKVELAGKVLVLVMALPMIDAVARLAIGLIQG